MKVKSTVDKVFRDEKSRSIVMYAAIFLLYVLYFRVILDSGLSADDMWNYNIQASKYTGGPNAWEVMKNQFLMWIQMGRLFPFSNYVQLLFSIMPSVVCYKACIVVSIYINNLISGWCLHKITGQRYSQYLYMLLLPLFLQLSPEFDSALYCYHMLMQLVVAWCFLSLWCLLQYMEQNKIRYAIGNVIFYFIALGTYEVAFVFILVLIITVFCKISDWKQRVKYCIPNVVTILIMGVLNVILKLNAQSGTYDGITVNLQIKPIIVTFLKQCSTCFPIGRYICYSVRYIEPYSDLYPYTLHEIIQQVRVLDVVTILLYIGLFLIIEYWYYKQWKKQTDGDNRLLLLIGLCLFVLPGVLIAVSVKYQNLLGWCSGHLPAYMQSFGVAFLVLGLYGLILKHCKGKKLEAVIRYVCLGIAVVIILLNQISGRIRVEYMNQYRKYPQENIALAAKEGLFDEFQNNEDKVLFGTTAYIYDQSSSRGFYSRFTQSNIYATPRQDVVNLVKENCNGENICELSDLGETEYYAMFNMAKRGSGAIILGRCIEVEFNDNQTDFRHVWVQNPSVFVQGDFEVDVTDDWTLIEDDKDYRIYELSGSYDIMQSEDYYKDEAGIGVLYR